MFEPKLFYMQMLRHDNLSKKFCLVKKENLARGRRVCNVSSCYLLKGTSICRSVALAIIIIITIIIISIIIISIITIIYILYIYYKRYYAELNPSQSMLVLEFIECKDQLRLRGRIRDRSKGHLPSTPSSTGGETKPLSVALADPDAFPILNQTFNGAPLV